MEVLGEEMDFVNRVRVALEGIFVQSDKTPTGIACAKQPGAFRRQDMASAMVNHPRLWVALPLRVRDPRVIRMICDQI